MNTRPENSSEIEMTEDVSDAVGYKSPPVKTRFRPGRSGNPSGRPKTKPSFRTALLGELAATMPAKDQQRAISKLQALVTTLVNSAVAGNARAQALLVGALLRMGEPEESGSDSLTPNDQAILEAYLAGELKRRADKTATAPDPGEKDAH